MELNEMRDRIQSELDWLLQENHIGINVDGVTIGAIIGNDHEYAAITAAIANLTHTLSMLTKLTPTPAPVKANHIKLTEIWQFAQDAGLSIEASDKLQAHAVTQFAPNAR